MTNPAALDEALEWVRAEKEIFDDLGLEPVCGHHMAALCEAARRYSAIVKAVEGGEKALVPMKPTEEVLFMIVSRHAISLKDAEFVYKSMLRSSGIDALIKGD